MIQQTRLDRNATPEQQIAQMYDMLITLTNGLNKLELRVEANKSNINKNLDYINNTAKIVRNDKTLLVDLKKRVDSL